MSKTRSKIKLIIVAILTILGLLLTFVSFVVPTTNTTFRGFFNAINYGYDLNGGYLVTYEVANPELYTEEEISSRLDETVFRLQSAFSSRGFNVTRQGETIRIEVSTYDNDSITSLMSRSSNSDIYSLIGAEKGISFNTDSSNADAEGSITTEYVAGCELGSSQANGAESIYPITITFTEEGQKLLKEMTTNIASDSSKKLYMYLNGNNYYSSGFEMSNGVSSITLSSSSQEGAVALYLQISALAKPIQLSALSSSKISGGLSTSVGKFFGNPMSMLYMALGLSLLAVVVLLVVRYRMLGVLAIMSFGIFIAVYSFLLQSIPLAAMDLSGVLGVAFTFFLLAGAMVDIFERVRYEYSLGKKIPNSVTSAFRKKTMPILEKYVFLVILCAVFYIVGPISFKAFAVSLFVGLFVNYFTLFVALRGTCMSYININATRKKLYNLKREATHNEI